jgi:hypothetical protein
MDSTSSSKIQCAHRWGARARLSLSEPHYCIRADHCIRLSVILGVRRVLCSHYHLRTKKKLSELKFERHREGPFCLILETRACPPLLSSVSSHKRTHMKEVRPSSSNTRRYGVCGLAAAPRGAQCGMKQKGPASDRDIKHRKRKN